MQAVWIRCFCVDKYLFSLFTETLNINLSLVELFNTSRIKIFFKNKKISGNFLSNYFSLSF